MSESRASDKKPSPADGRDQSPASNVETASLTDAAAWRSNPLEQISSLAHQIPLRHHTRHGSRPKREVKETLNAKSEYSTSQDDGTAQHRINQYIIKQEIGRGSFGAVHLATDQYGHEFAVKEFSKSRLRKRAQSNLLRRPKGVSRPSTQMAAGVGFNSPLHRHGSLDDADDQAFDLIKEEIAVMKKLNHPNVVNLIEVLDDPDEDSLYMVLEMCKRGVVMNVGLENRADPYDDETCRRYFRDMILGMEYLHTQGIIHRDIKPDNCLVTADNVVKIVDFGVSEMFEKASAMNTAKSAGSPAFMPPELCVARHGEVSGKKADIWSMGVTLYCLRFGQIPFEKDAMLELYDSIRKDDLQIPGDVDTGLRDLLTRLLEKDPNKRISMDEIREHPWVTNGGTDPLISKEENAAELIEPPTEEELNTAITGNIKRLLVVMKAVKRFKQKLIDRHPELVQGIFGSNTRFVQPPTSMKQTGSTPGSMSSADLSGQPKRADAQSDSKDERLAQDVSKALNQLPPGVDEVAITAEHSKDSSTPTAIQLEPMGDNAPSEPIRVGAMSPDHGSGKGQAHDPLEDTLFLNIGNGNDGPVTSSSDKPVVSESPGAVSMNVYELAYQEEIDRILGERSANEPQRRPTLFLTRRVEDVKHIRDNVHLCALERIESVKSAASDSGKSGLAGLVSRAKANAHAVVEEYDRRKGNKPEATTTEP